MIYSIHRLDPANLGDQVCGALQCAGITFDKLLDIEASHAIHTDDVIVYGGGGLLHGLWLEWMHEMAHRRHRPYLIAWGIGMNMHDTQTLVWPDFFNRYDLVGLRDYGNPWNYVPCPSVMRKEFMEVFIDPVPITRPLVNFKHHALDPWPSEAPFMDNNQPSEKFGEVLRFLASAEVVQTSTFHGAYWSLLLGRKVCLHDPKHSRMFSFPERLPTSPDKAVAWPDYYRECYALNESFKKRVIRFLDL